MSLFKHWKRTSFHPIRHLIDNPRSAPRLMNPRILMPWGIRRHLEVIDMHRQYFLPGKLEKGQATLVEFVDEVVEPHIRDDPNETLVESAYDWYFN
jgi:hypothetical protein